MIVGFPHAGRLELTVLREDGDESTALTIVGGEDGVFFLEPDADGNCFAIAPFDVDPDGVTMIPEGDIDEELEPDADTDTDGDADAETEPVGSTAATPESATSTAVTPVLPLSADSAGPAAAAAGTASSAESPASATQTQAQPSSAEAEPPLTTADVVKLNSTRVFLRNPPKNLYYYADRAQGEIFCWNRATGALGPVK